MKKLKYIELKILTHQNFFILIEIKFFHYNKIVDKLLSLI